MQQEVSDFKANLLNMYKQHLEQITAIPDYDDEEEEEPAAEPAQAAEQEAVQTAEAAPPQQEQHAPAAQAEVQDTEATRVMENPYRQQQETSRYPFDDTSAAGTVKAESKFGELKFGRNK